ncbi:MAG TPA: asparagine synthase (glutamine-hydrolyzing) [Candidatus Sulfopaludibacter sp.]|nr:asparagine synthase (glutamine-hydrolyzing) [Candidatus Sulfopaludibacter sp.]
MCGIYFTNRKFAETEVENKLNLIRYRGPDNTGVLKMGDVILGHLRLAILDLDQRSNQPMHLNELTIVYNGEIYNFLSLKEELIELGHQFSTTSDTEVLLHGYQEWGSQVLQKLNGMFAFAIYDSLNQKVFSARDRLGVKPFYYYWKDGEFEICSQIRPILNKDSQISDDAISIYLDCGYVPSPFSIIKDVYKLPPGKYMEIDLQKGTKTEKEYWNLKAVELKEISYDEAKKQLHELLIDAVKIRLQSDVPIGTFLSGGIDSALVSAIASRISRVPINTFTIGFQDPKFDESKVAAEFAKIIGSTHVETKFTQKDALNMITKQADVFDEPFADSSALPSLVLNSVTKKFVSVALSGDGGDESFFGYINFDKIAKFNKINKIPYVIRKIIAKLFFANFLSNKFYTIKSVLNTKDSNKFSEQVFSGYDSIQQSRNTKWWDYYADFKYWSGNILQRLADLNIKLWLENDSNVKVDRASMAFSVEVRSPFLDYRVIEFARTLPIQYRYQRGRKKRILRDLLKNYIPESIFDQPKKGFSVPLAKWIREDLKDDILFELNDKFLSSIKNLNTVKFKFQLNQHLTGKADFSFNIWKLYILSKWYKQFNNLTTLG